MKLKSASGGRLRGIAAAALSLAVAATLASCGSSGSSSSGPSAAESGSAGSGSAGSGSAGSGSAASGSAGSGSTGSASAGSSSASQSGSAAGSADSASAPEASGSSASASSEGGAGDFPSRPIQLIVPFAAGGGTDQIARSLAKAATDTCGTNITVLNKTGASGTTGLKDALSATPDGYTVGFATSSTLLASLFGIGNITPADVQTVMQINEDASVLAVGANSPYKTIKDFLDAAKAGKKLLVSTSGSGSIWELAFLGMADTAGVPPMTNVPYDGAAPAIVAAVGGEVDATSSSGVEERSQIEAGKLRALAAMSDQRLSFLPDTPTLKEEGVDWTEGVWRGLVVAPKTPKPIVTALESCFHKAYESDAFQSFMKTQGFEVAYKSSDDFATYLDSVFSAQKKLVDKLGLAK